MTKRDLFDAIGQMDAAYCRQAFREPEKTSEPSRMLRWTSAAAAAAVFAVVAGGAVWFIGSMQSGDGLRAGYAESSELLAEVTEAVTELTETEPLETTSTEPEEELYYAELELHADTPPVYTMEEATALIEAGMEAFAQNPRINVIDTAPYIMTFREAHGDPQATQSWLERLNSLEYKSYIYHMMLNSIDYFETAQGTMTYSMADDPSYAIYIEFQTDMRTQRAYESTSQFDTLICETFVCDEMQYDVDVTSRAYQESRCGGFVDCAISDNDRVCTLTDGTALANNRSDMTHLGIAGNSCLFPQTFATSHLSDFDCWEITMADDNLLGFGTNSAFIEGTYKGDRFKMYVDVSTGILMKYEVYDAYGAVKSYIEVDALEVDTEFEVKLFDPEDYTAESPVFPKFDGDTPEEHDDDCR